MAQNGGGRLPPPPRLHLVQQHIFSGRESTMAATAATAAVSTTTATATATTTVFSRNPTTNQFLLPMQLPTTTTTTTMQPLLPASIPSTNSHHHHHHHNHHLHVHHQHQQFQRQPQDLNNRDFISLSQPRPGIARIRNEYIETPLRPLGTTTTTTTTTPATPIPPSSSSSTTSSSNVTSNLLILSKSGSTKCRSSSPAGVHRQDNQNSIRELIQLPQSRTSLSSTNANTMSPSAVIIRQPSRKPITNNDLTNSLKRGSDINRTLLPLTRTSSSSTDSHPIELHSVGISGDSIICRECKRCKCAACGSPRPLPSTWICHDKYQCSAETLVDQCSCMCCVKGVFYHLNKNFEDFDDDYGGVGSDASGGTSGGFNCADSPCSCQPHRRCSRWACIGLLTALMPCLLCYWPLRGCLRLCEFCYTKYNNRHACQCATKSSSIMSTISSSSSTSDHRNKIVGDVTSLSPGIHPAIAVPPPPPPTTTTTTMTTSSKRLLFHPRHHFTD